MEIISNLTLTPTGSNKWAWGTISPAYSNSWGGDDMNIWIPSYNWLGYVHHFLSLIDDLQPVGVTAEDKEEYKGECYFLGGLLSFPCASGFRSLSYYP